MSHHYKPDSRKWASSRVGRLWHDHASAPDSAHPTPGGTLGKYVSFAIFIVVKAVTLLFYRVRGRDIEGGPIPGHPWRTCGSSSFSTTRASMNRCLPPSCRSGVSGRSPGRRGRPGGREDSRTTDRRPLLPTADPAARVRHSRGGSHLGRGVERTGDDSMVLILPEGRMRRRNGLDSEGRPMTARGGVADILRAIDDGQLLMAYSGGLHHVQIPASSCRGSFARSA